MDKIFLGREGKEPSKQREQSIQRHSLMRLGGIWEMLNSVIHEHQVWGIRAPGNKDVCCQIGKLTRL